MTTTIDKKKLEEDLLKCAHCGMCLAVCPVYRETLVETDSPRARIALMRAKENKEIKESGGFTEKIYDCTTCMACSHVCPSGVHPDELVLAARAQTENKPAPLQKFIINKIISVPANLRRMLLPVVIYQKSGLRKLAQSTHLLNLFPQRLSRFDDMLPRLDGKTIYKGKKLEFNPTRKVLHSVGYFPGCAMNLVFTSVGRATIRVLLRNHSKVTIPEGVLCCGMPHVGYGEVEEAKKLARQNIDAFEKAGVSHIITDCATCGSTLKSYVSLLADDPVYAAKASAFSKKVRDITEFLINDIELDRNFRQLDIKATYHEPCHLGRGQNLKEAPRKLLKEILGPNYVEMVESDSCCGGAGSYTITHPDVSMKILDRKMKNLRDTGAEVIVTACPGCEIQLAQGIKRSKQKVRLMHIVELLNEAYNKAEEGPLKTRE